MTEQDIQFMQRALKQAQIASELGEVPVGAVIVLNGEVIAEAHNSPISNCDPTGHAEINALRKAAENIGNYRLNGADIYVTLEPCVMCAGALVHARIAHCYFGAHDLRSGALETKFSISQSPDLNHKIDYAAGLLADESVAMLQSFFRQRR